MVLWVSGNSSVYVIENSSNTRNTLNVAFGSTKYNQYMINCKSTGIFSFWNSAVVILIVPSSNPIES